MGASSSHPTSPMQTDSHNQAPESQASSTITISPELHDRLMKNAAQKQRKASSSADQQSVEQQPQGTSFSIDTTPTMPSTFSFSNWWSPATSMSRMSNWEQETAVYLSREASELASLDEEIDRVSKRVYKSSRAPMSCVDQRSAVLKCYREHDRESGEAMRCEKALLNFFDCADQLQQTILATSADQSVPQPSEHGLIEA
eukprot:GILK01006767.1.p1 GENE.GILK01006767.1~~GILK01006767.1.p1  ORF type:complete len:225 (-),score=24.41 GILK01006767.1:120-719(-)